MTPGSPLPPRGRACATPDGSAARPARLSGTEEYPIGEELLVYVPRSGTAYALNRSAAAIWHLCDGIRTIEEITEELGQWISRTRATLLPDVTQGVTRLHEWGLLELR